MKNTDVIIVGAGPVGLTLALLLTKFGVNFIIVDKLSYRSEKSKAMTITPRTLEQLNLIGVADDLVRNGITANHINYYYKTHFISRSDFRSLESKYPFILQISQATTTEILEKHALKIGVNIKSSCEFINFKKFDDCIVSEFRDYMGKVFSLSSQYLIACDGARSTVRFSDGVDFKGDKSKEKFLMADIVMENFPFPFQERHLFYLPKRSFFYVMPIQKENQKNIYRIITTNDSISDFSDESILKMFQDIMKSLNIFGVILKEPRWISQFNPRQFIVEDFFRDRILYAGDAAHIQSPIGSQGLNTGIQDAFNLAWRLVVQLRKQPKKNILNGYNKERKLIAENLFKRNEKISKTIFGVKGFKRLYSIAGHFLNRFNNANKNEINNVSQLSVSYSQGKNLIGKRLDNFYLENRKSIYDLLPANKFSLICKLNKLESNNQIKKILSATAPYSDLIECFFIHANNEKISSCSKNVFSVKGAAFLNQKAICLVRPDTYIESFYEYQNFEREFSIFDG